MERKERKLFQSFQVWCLNKEKVTEGIAEMAGSAGVQPCTKPNHWILGRSGWVSPFKAHTSLCRRGMSFPSVNKDQPLAALQLLLLCSSFSEATHSDGMSPRFRVTLADPHGEQIETCDVNHFKLINQILYVCPGCFTELALWTSLKLSLESFRSSHLGWFTVSAIVSGSQLTYVIEETWIMRVCV